MKNAVERKLTPEIVSSLDPSAIKAIAFAEVGAQGNPEFVTLISVIGDEIVKDTGRFGYEFSGERYAGDIDVEMLEGLVPFLRHFRGVSIETTVRGNCCSEDGAWIHLDAGFGNHFFVRFEYFVAFGNRFMKRQTRDLYSEAIPVMIELLNSSESEKGK